MPGHNSIINGVTMEQIKRINPKTVVDVGSGSGFYGSVIKQRFPKCHVVGVEIFKPYIENYNLNNIYDKIINENIIDIIDSLNGDLIIFGNVIEHLNKEDALKVLDKAINNFNFVIINTPRKYAPQQAINGNIYEVHLCQIGKEDCNNYDIIEYREFDVMINILIKGKYKEKI